MVKVEIDLIKQKLKQEAEKNVKKIRHECELLRGRVNEVGIDNSRTKIINKSLRVELEEASKVLIELNKTLFFCFIFNIHYF